MTPRDRQSPHRRPRSRRRGPRIVAAAGVAALTMSLVPAATAAPPSAPGQPGSASASASAPASTPDSTPRVGAGQGDGIRERQLTRALRQVERDGAIGVTAELVTPDGVWRGAVGDASRDPRRSATRDARFRAASVSKQLVTVLALQLVDRGRWSLDTTIGDVLPRLWPARSEVTLRQLLSHTSGLPEFLTPLLGTDPSTAAFKRVISKPRTDRELVRAARSEPLLPTGRFAYANTNFVVVGMMLEQTTGRSASALVRQRIFEPTRMTRSTWPGGRVLAQPRLQEYGRLYGKVENLSGFHPSMFSSAGRLVSTARDLNRFQRALSRGELISDRLVRTMRTPVARGEANVLDYGLGSYRVPDPCRPGRFVHGHDGGSWGTLTLSYASPDGERRVTVAMTGRDFDGDLASATSLSRVAVLALAQTCGGVPQQPDGAAVAGFGARLQASVP